MALPEAVRLAGEAADEAVEAFDKANAEDNEQGSSLDDVVGADDQTQGDGSGDDGDEGESGDGDDGAGAGDGGLGEGSDEGGAANADDAKWEQKYRTLQGKYNAEIGRLTRDIDYLRGSVETMATARAAAAPAEGADGAAATAPGFKKYLKDDEVKEYDDDILDFQSRVARGEAEAVAEPMVAKLLARIE